MEETRPRPLPYASPTTPRQRRAPVPGLAGRILSAVLILLVGAAMGCAVVENLFTRLARNAWPTDWGWVVVLGVTSVVFVVGGTAEMRSALAQRQERPSQPSEPSR